LLNSDTRVPTVIANQGASAVAKPTLPTCAKNPRIYRLPALYVGKTILPTTEDALYTKDSKDPETRRTLVRTHPFQPDNNEQHTQQNNSKGKPLSNVTFPRSYSDTVKSPNPSNPQKGEPNETPLSTQLSSFLENFQSLITPLINLLTTLINKILINNEH
jgi:hypothetical protein